MTFHTFLVPIIIDTQLQATDCLWNHDGSVLAICGMKAYGGEKDSNLVMFYSPLGTVSRDRKSFPNFRSKTIFTSHTASSYTENSRTRDNSVGMGRAFTANRIGCRFVHLFRQYSSRLYVVLFR